MIRITTFGLGNAALRLYPIGHSLSHNVSSALELWVAKPPSSAKKAGVTFLVLK